MKWLFVALLMAVSGAASASDIYRDKLVPVSWWQTHQAELRKQMAYCRQYHPDIVSNPNCATAMSAMAGRK